MERTRGWVIALLCALGILASVATYGPALRFSARGVNDFRTFYPGARLAGSPGMYDPALVRAVQAETTGKPDRDLPYCRLPYFALLLAPLGHLPYLTAYWIWEGLCLAAAIAFALLWTVPDRKAIVLACCWSLPLFGALAVGQDIPLLLLTIAVSMRLETRQRSFAAGLVFALCAAKFHLFLLLPVLIVMHRMWRFAAGLLTGGGVLLALSFLAGGANWPRGYMAVLASPEANPNAIDMPNLHGLVAATAGGLRLELVLAAVVAVLVWLAVRKTGFEYAFAAMMTGSLLVSHHAYMADCALLMPALLMIAAHAETGWLRAFALFLLTPICYVFTLMGSAIWITRGALVLFLIGVVWTACRDRHGPEAVPAGATAA